jgi:lipopolysaccharide biosynthesis regulator YciM
MLSETRVLPDSYFRGLNFLLNEEPDRAIDAFIEVAKLDPETTELHFALGNLFRRRGEMERAIRVHQSLLNRADLPVAEREHAQHELAQDFLKAGMLDRAEAGFKQLSVTRYALPALRSLLRIYEFEHDWPRAIEIVKTLCEQVEEPVPQLGHYHCELAQLALSKQPPAIEAAQTSLKAAEYAAMAASTLASKACRVRIALLQAWLAELTTDYQRERMHLESVLTDAPDYAGLVAEPLCTNYHATGQLDVALELLQKQYAKCPSLDLFNIVFRQLRRQQGTSPAWAFARTALHHHPSLLGLDRLLEAELATLSSIREENSPIEAGVALSEVRSTSLLSGADLSLLRSLIHKHTQRLDRYACRNCGFQARRYYWQCPGCNTWESYAPRRLEELE